MRTTNEGKPPIAKVEVVDSVKKNDNDSNGVRDWVTEQIKDQVKEQGTSYVTGKAAQFAAKTALGAKFLFFMRWFSIVEWGALGIGVLLTFLSVADMLQQKSILLGVLGLIFAAIAFGVWFLARKVRHFIEQQIAHGMAKFVELAKGGKVEPSDWPNWYNQNKGNLK